MTEQTGLLFKSEGFNAIAKDLGAYEKGARACKDETKEFAAATKDLAAQGEAWIKVTRQQYQTLEQVEKALKATESKLAGLRYSKEKATDETRETIKILQQEQFALRRLKQEYGETAREVDRAAQERIRAERQAARESEQAARESTRAQEQYAQAWHMNIKKMVLWALGARTAFRLFSQIRNELRDTFLELYENTEEWKRFKLAYEGVMRALVVSAIPQGDLLEFLDNAAAYLNRTSEGFLQASAAVAGLSGAYQELTGMTLDPLRDPLGPGPLIGAIEGAVRLIRGQTDAQAVLTALYESYTDRLEESKDALDELGQESSEYQSALESLITATQRWDQQLIEHKQRLGEIRAEYEAARASAITSFYAQLEDIEADYQDRISDINENADKQRRKAQDNYNKRRVRAQKQANDAERQLQERHQLQMEFARRRYELSVLQSEAMYQYERGMLVAEGDVLAIEDLDARHRLEEQARRENYDLQMQQAEAMFQLQLRYQRQASREQAQLLRQALADQLRQIEEARQEQVEEAREGADDQRTEAKEGLQDQLSDAQDAYKKQLDAQNDHFNDLRQAHADFAADFGRQWDISASQVVQLFGASGAMEMSIRAAFARWAAYAAQLGPSLQFSMGGNIRRRYRTPRGHQYGGEFIASTPTPIMVGEGYQPERVSITPLSPIGGAVSVAWHGGAIPVHGTGAMDGADLSAVGDALAQGLVIGLQGSLLRFRGQRG